MRIRGFILLALAPLLPCRAETTYSLPATASAIVEDEAAYAAFAAPVVADAATLLAASPPQALAKVLFAIRVHHSLHTGADAAALDSARRIRELLPEGAGRAYAGLTTQAFVAAHQASGRRPGDPRFNAAFARSFGARLATLAMTTAMRVELEAQHAKLAGMTAETLRKELAATTAGIGNRRECTLAEADQLIRLHHRLADLLPLRAEMLQALVAAAAARPKS